MLGIALNQKSVNLHERVIMMMIIIRQPNCSLVSGSISFLIAIYASFWNALIMVRNQFINALSSDQWTEFGVFLGWNCLNGADYMLWNRLQHQKQTKMETHTHNSAVCLHAIPDHLKHHYHPFVLQSYLMFCGELVVQIHPISKTREKWVGREGT